MKKKIDYANIEKKVLKMTIGECYGLGDYTLQDELDKYGEDIIVAQYNLKEHEGPNGTYKYIEWFRAWTQTKVMCMVSSGFGDNVILALERQIPEELEVKFRRPIGGEEVLHYCSDPGYNCVVKLDIEEKNGRPKEKRKRAKRSNNKTNKRKR
jgi:hypothetical protein